MKSIMILSAIIIIYSCTSYIPVEPNKTITKTYYLSAYDYSNNCFFLDTAYINVWEDYFKKSTPELSEQFLNLKIKPFVRVWESTESIDNSSYGIAIADLYGINLDLDNLRMIYPESLKSLQAKDGEIEFAKWKLLDSFDFNLDYHLGYISIKKFDKNKKYAITYRIESNTSSVNDDIYFGTDINNIKVGDTLILKLLYSPNINPSYKTLWQRQMKNSFPIDYSIYYDTNKIDIKIIYIDDKKNEIDTLPELNYNLVTVFGVDRKSTNGLDKPDGKFDMDGTYRNFLQDSTIVFPSLQPFNYGLSEFFNKMNRTDLISKYCYPDVYIKMKDEAKMALDKDRFKIKVQITK